MIFRANIIRPLICAVLALAALQAAAQAQGIHGDYLPFDKSRLRRFPLKRSELPGDVLRSGQPFVISGVKMQEEEREVRGRGVAQGSDEAQTQRRLVFSGRDKRGDEWRIETSGHVYYESVYEGDLDRNGVRDLVLAIGTGGNGLAPPTELLFLTFDRRGRPTLLTATGYFDPQPEGIYDVFDMDGDGRAELLHMMHDDGYWITNIYRIREARWSRARGSFAGLRLPAYTRFTNRPNHKPVRPAPGRKPVAPDLLEGEPKRNPGSR